MKRARIWRYEVTDVYGSMVGCLEVGAVIYDRWKANRNWHVVNFHTGDQGGWVGKLLGEASPEMTDKFYRDCDRRPIEAGVS